MIKRILIPFDGSKSSQVALSIASSISALTQSELMGLYVQNKSRLERVNLAVAVAENFLADPIPTVPLPPDEMIQEEEKLESEAEALKIRFDETVQKAKVISRFVVGRGNPAEVIVGWARAVDLVVIGNSGKHTGVTYFDEGLTTNTLLHGTTRPVLVVPDEPQGQSIVVVAYDGSAASERVLRVAAELASLTDMDEVHLLTVSSDEAAAKELQVPAAEYLRAYDLEVACKIFSGKAEVAIKQYVDSVDASILALGAFGTNRFYDRIFGSTAEHLLHSVEAGILLVS